MGNEVQNDQFHFGVPMVRLLLLFFGKNWMGMGDYPAVFQLMGVEKQYPIGQNGQHQSQTEMAQEGQYFPYMDHKNYKSSNCKFGLLLRK